MSNLKEKLSGTKNYYLACGAWYFLGENNDDSFLFIEFYHPSAAVKRETLFAYAKEVFKNIFEDQRLQDYRIAKGLPSF